MNRKYSGFTLIEMLIVMGIMIILIAVGIAAGRFAINRANDVAHQNAADQLFTAATSHMTDWREYPEMTNFATALACDGKVINCLGDYLSTGEFRGGSDATYYYWVDDAKFAALVCVSLGGVDDEQGRGFYCTGTGFGATDVPGAITEKDLDANTVAGEGGPGNTAITDWNIVQDWDNASSEFNDPTEGETE